MAGALTVLMLFVYFSFILGIAFDKARLAVLAQAGVDAARLQQDMAAPEIAERVALDVADARDCARKFRANRDAGLLLFAALAADGLIDPRQPWYPGRPVLVTRNDPALGANSIYVLTPNREAAHADMHAQRAAVVQQVFALGAAQQGAVGG